MISSLLTSKKLSSLVNISAIAKQTQILIKKSYLLLTTIIVDSNGSNKKEKNKY